jgi:GT2 family glycosyltransferase
MTTANLTLSVIIPVYNGGEKFRRCLESLRFSSRSPTEIIVVADGDSDGSWRVAEEFGAEVIRLTETGGPARARNVGARVAHSDVLVFFDADVAVAPDTLQRMVTTLEREPELAAVFGSYDDTPAAPNFLSQYKNLFHHYVHQHGRAEAATFWAGCGAVRRNVFLALGGFDEGYRQPSIEDIELGYRLRRAGHRIRLLPAAQVKHLKWWTAGSLLRADVLLRAVPWTELMQRDGQMLNDLNLTWSARVAVGLAGLGLLELVAAAWWPWLLGLAVASLAAMWMLQAGLLRFFATKRGVGFAVKAAPWLWLYNLYSGLGFAVGLVRHWTR